MESTKSFQVTLKLETNKDPKELIDVLTKLFLKEALHVMSYDYHEIVTRELSAEHHGGYQES